MMRRLAWLGIAVAIGATPALAAGQSHADHATETHAHSATASGTVERVEKGQLTIKTSDGKSLSFKLGEKVTIERDGVAIASSKLQVGEPVAVEHDGAASPLATKVRAGKAAMGAYFCPMDTDVVSDKPGRCPKCNMFLEKRKGG